MGANIGWNDAVSVVARPHVQTPRNGTVALSVHMIARREIFLCDRCVPAKSIPLVTYAPLWARSAARWRSSGEDLAAPMSRDGSMQQCPQRHPSTQQSRRASPSTRKADRAAERRAHGYPSLRQDRHLRPPSWPSRGRPDDFGSLGRAGIGRWRRAGSRVRQGEARWVGGCRAASRREGHWGVGIGRGLRAAPGEVAVAALTSPQP